MSYSPPIGTTDLYLEGIKTSLVGTVDLAKVVVVSPTQIATLLWFEELHKMYWEASYDFGGELRADSFMLNLNSFMLGVTYEPEGLESLVNFASPNTLFIFNGSDVLSTAVQAVGMICAGYENGKLLSLGNFDPRDVYEKS